MATMMCSSSLSHRSLMKKSKYELCRFILDLLGQLYPLKELTPTPDEPGYIHTPWGYIPV